jgi:hypothetical protein
MRRQIQPAAVDREDAKKSEERKNNKVCGGFAVPVIARSV